MIDLFRHPECRKDTLVMSFAWIATNLGKVSCRILISIQFCWKILRIQRYQDDWLLFTYRLLRVGSQCIRTEWQCISISNIARASGSTSFGGPLVYGSLGSKTNSCIILFVVWNLLHCCRVLHWNRETGFCFDWY